MKRLVLVALLVGLLGAAGCGGGIDVVGRYTMKPNPPIVRGKAIQMTSTLELKKDGTFDITASSGDVIGPEETGSYKVKDRTVSLISYDTSDSTHKERVVIVLKIDGNGNLVNEKFIPEPVIWVKQGGL